MIFTLEKIKKAINGLRDDLGDGFVKTDIWNTKTLKSVIINHSAGMLPIYGMVPKYIKKFSEVSKTLMSTLQESGFTELGDYYLVKLEDNKVVMILCYRSEAVMQAKLGVGKIPAESKGEIDYQQYILADMEHTTIGALMGIALPNLLKNILS